MTHRRTQKNTTINLYSVRNTLVYIDDYIA